MNMIPIKDIGREEWLKLRRNGIGGSDAAAIIGLNPYSSAFQVYCDKVGLLPETEDNEAMRQGRDFEAYVAERFEEAAEKRVRRCNNIITNPAYPFMLANVDRLVVGEKAGLECKTTSVFNKADFESGDVPTQYYVQCQHYMAVTGYKKWYLAVLVLNRGFYWYEIPYNDDDVSVLIEAEREFWENYVVPHKEPAPDGSPKAAEAIRQLYGRGDDDITVGLHGYDKDLARYDEIDALRKKLEREQEAIKQKLQLEMKDATLAYAGNKVITWKNIASTRIDSKRLKAEQPDIYEKFSKKSEYRRFEIKEAK